MSNKSWFINRVDSVKPFKESVYSVQTSGLLEELLGSTDQLLQVCRRTFQRIYILFVFNIYICAFLGSVRKLCDSAHSRQRKTGTQVQDRWTLSISFWILSFIPLVKWIVTRNNFFLNVSNSSSVLFSELCQWSRGQLVSTQVCKVGDRFQWGHYVLSRERINSSSDFTLGLWNTFEEVED